MARILVYGSVNMDLVVTTATFPRPGETVAGEAFATVPGGKGANQAVACARLGGAATFAGCLGEDAFGAELLAGLAREGVDTRYLRREPGVASGVALIIVERSGQNSIVVAAGANARNQPADAARLQPALRQAEALLCQLEMPLPALAAMMQAARGHGVRVVLDAGPARKLPVEIVALADVISPNETETQALTGIAVDGLAAARRAAQALLDQGPGAVVLKLGAQGCLVRTAEQEEHLPALPITPVDTTAAGDAFTAALTVALCEGRDLVSAARFANCAGALAATVFGAQPSMPTRPALEAFARERSEQTA